MPPVDSTTLSKIVASCHGWPPCAIAMKPAFCTFSASAMNSSKFFGSVVTPALASTSLFAQIQLVVCRLTGAAIHLPSYFENFWIASGVVFSQLFFAATSLRSASTPCFAQSRMSKPSICTAVGGLPAVTRARTAVMAASPPPPATGLSFQGTPCFSRLVFSTWRAPASPPDVHQCRTSTESAADAIPAQPNAPASTVAIIFLLMFSSYLSLICPIAAGQLPFLERHSVPNSPAGHHRSYMRL